MLIGAHLLIYSTNPEADRAFLRDTLGLPNVDVGDGWLIFGLPSAELAVHPSDQSTGQELYLMCDDVEELSAKLQSRGIICGPIQDTNWGRLRYLQRPGGGKLGAYQPRHARPPATDAR